MEHEVRILVQVQGPLNTIEVKALLDSGVNGCFIDKSWALYRCLKLSKLMKPVPVSRTKHVWYSEHGMYCRFEIILERAMSATHVAVIPHTRTSPAYEEEFTKMDYPDVRNGYGMS